MRVGDTKPNVPLREQINWTVTIVSSICVCALAWLRITDVNKKKLELDKAGNTRVCYISCRRGNACLPPHTHTSPSRHEGNSTARAWM